MSSNARIFSAISLGALLIAIGLATFVNLPSRQFGAAREGSEAAALFALEFEEPIVSSPVLMRNEAPAYNLPPDTESLPENAGVDTVAARRFIELDGFKKTGYGGPCPPIGRHRYFHKLYALDITLDLRGATKSQIERAMRGHVLANAELIRRVSKGDR